MERVVIKKQGIVNQFNLTLDFIILIFTSVNMKIALLVLATTGFLVFNIYHDNKYMEILKSWKKYYQMAAVGFIGFSLFIFLRKQPAHTHSLMEHATKLVQYAPIDKEATDLLKPLFWFGEQSVRGNPFGASPMNAQYTQQMPPQTFFLSCSLSL